jgi:hypothetical protein
MPGDLGVAWRGAARDVAPAAAHGEQSLVAGFRPKGAHVPQPNVNGEPDDCYGGRHGQRRSRLRPGAAPAGSGSLLSCSNWRQKEESDTLSRWLVFTTATKDEVTAIVVRALSPYVGATMASASVRGLCEKLRLEGAKLGLAEVQELIDALAPGLHVYIGKEKARMVIQQIWTAMDGLGAGT